MNNWLISNLSPYFLFGFEPAGKIFLLDFLYAYSSSCFLQISPNWYRLPRAGKTACPFSRAQPVTQKLSYILLALTQYLVNTQPVLPPTYEGVFHVKTLVLSPALLLYVTYQVAALCLGHLKSGICWLLNDQCFLTHIFCNVQKLPLTLETISLVLQTMSCIWAPFVTFDIWSDLFLGVCV